VLLSSGLGGSGAYWQPQIAALSAGHRVITYDQRGTGHSMMPLPEDYSIAAMAEDVIDVLDAAECASVHFVGHALGGLVGLDLALRHPARLASLTLVNAWARLDSHTARCFAVRKDLLLNVGIAAYVRAQPIFLHPAAWLSAHAERLAQEEAHGIAHFQGVETLLRRIGALMRFDVAGRLGEIATPTLVAATRDDVLVPYTCSERLAAGIPGAVFDLAPSGGHASNVTDPAPFNATLLRFLARQGG
jgi:aminoacrylate hydrolase